MELLYIHMDRYQQIYLKNPKIDKNFGTISLISALARIAKRF